MAGGSPLVAPALRLAARDGGSSADTFERLAVRSQQRTELDREVMVATAQSRHSVRLMVVLPVAVFAVLLATGHLARLAAAGPAGTAALAVGVALQSLGLLAMAAMTQRAAS